MNGKIDKDGFLYIERPGKIKGQLCAYDSSGSPCGDHCPMFGEPSEYNFPHSEKIRLDICDCRSLHFDRFDDQRKK